MEYYKEQGTPTTAKSVTPPSILSGSDSAQERPVGLVEYVLILRARWRLVLGILILVLTSTTVTLVVSTPPVRWEAVAVIWIDPTHDVRIRGYLGSAALVRDLGLRGDAGLGDAGLTLERDKPIPGLTTVTLTAAAPGRLAALVGQAIDRVWQTVEAEQQAHRRRLTEHRARQIATVRAELQTLPAVDGQPDGPVPVAAVNHEVLIVGSWPTPPAQQRRAVLETRLAALLEDAPPVREAPVLVLIDPAVESRQPRARNWWWALQAAAVGGGVLGIFSALVAEWWRREMVLRRTV